MYTHFQNLEASQLKYKVHDVRQKPFQIYGLYQSKESGLFKRMPEDVAQTVSSNVARLNFNPSGGRIRFKTNSRFIAIKVKYENIPPVAARVAAFGVSGGFFFDLYADGEFKGLFRPTPDIIKKDAVIPTISIAEEGFEAVIDLQEKKERDIIIHFPIYAHISQVLLALDEDASLVEGNEYPNKQPIVFYGSSITQGCCASRPGNIYQNILSRKLNFDYINLGFSSSAMAEDAMIDYISGLSMDGFVYDYDHNAPDVEYLKETHLPALKKIREKHPSIPILILSRPNQCGGKEEALERLKVIEETYQYFAQKGDRNIYFINGQDVFESIEPNLMTVDGVHPNDFGFYCMARALEPVMKNWFS